MATLATASAAAEPTGAQSVVIITITSSQDTSQETIAPVVVTAFSTVQFTPTTSAATTSTRPSVSSTAISGQSRTSSGGLGTGGTIAIAVAVPVVVIAVLLILAALFWRRRRRNRTALAKRKEEHDQYAFHPNETSFAAPVMAQYGNTAGTTQGHGANAYRGWQPTDTAGPPAPLLMSGYQPGRGTNSNNAVPSSNHGGISSDSQTSYLEKPTLPAIANMDDLDSVDGDHDRNRDWSALSPGQGSPPLNALNTGSPSSNYSTNGNDDGMFQNNASQGYSVRSSRLMPALQPGHQRPVSNALRDQSYFDN